LKKLLGLASRTAFPTVDEGEELLAEHAVEDGSAADDKVVLVPVDAFAVGFKHVHHVGLVAFGNDGFPNAAGDTSGMAGAAVVNNKHRLHVLFSKRVAGAQASARRKMCFKSRAFAGLPYSRLYFSQVYIVRALTVWGETTKIAGKTRCCKDNQCYNHALVTATVRRR